MKRRGPVYKNIEEEFEIEVRQTAPKAEMADRQQCKESMRWQNEGTHGRRNKWADRVQRKQAQAPLEDSERTEQGQEQTQGGGGDLWKECVAGGESMQRESEMAECGMHVRMRSYRIEE